MLYNDKDKTYIVYPSWIDVPYKWIDLPRLFKDPMKSGYIDPNYEWSKTPQWVLDNSIKYELLDMPHRGGIIIIHSNFSKSCPLFYAILFSHANVTAPHSFNGIYQFNGVSYIEHHERDIWADNFPFEKPRKFYICRIDFTHIEMDNSNNLYWVFLLKKASPKSIKSIDEILSTSKYLRSIEKVSAIPSEIQRRIAPRPGVPLCYKIEYDNSSLQYQMSLLVYYAYLFAKELKNTIGAALLAADIEGKPTTMKNCGGLMGE